jgi:hypothetical protein
MVDLNFKVAKPISPNLHVKRQIWSGQDGWTNSRLSTGDEFGNWEYVWNELGVSFE